MSPPAAPPDDVGRADPANLRLALARVEAAANRLARTTTIADRLQSLTEIAAGCLADDTWIEQAAGAVSSNTGYSAPMVRCTLERTLTAFSKPFLDAIPFPGARDGHHVRPPRLVVAVLAQNTPGLAIAPTFTALALGAGIVVKSARGEPSFAPRLVEAIARANPALGAAAAALLWRGGDAAMDRLASSCAERLVVYGGEVTIAAARAHAGERVLARGPGVSLAAISARADGTPPCEFPDALAASLAREIALLDQRGCLSPQAVLLDARLDATSFADALAREMARIETIWPRRKLSAEAGAAFRRTVDEAEADLLAGRLVDLRGGGAARWAITIEREARLRPTPLDRFVPIVPYATGGELAALLEAAGGRLECLGIAGDHDVLTRAGVTAGAVRICPVERMQDPPAEWQIAGSGSPTDWLVSTGIEGGGTSRSDAPSNVQPASEPSSFDRFRRYVAQTSDSPRGIEVVRARGARIWDAEGRSWLDLLSGIGVASIGHAHPEVARAIAAQARRYTHVMVYGEDILAPQVQLAERLARRLPTQLSVTYLVNSGAEGIEAALKLVRKATGRARVIAFERAFHGDTTGALALGGNPFYREPFRPLVPEVTHLPWDDLDSLRWIDETVAGVFAEPVQAEAGVRVPSATFLPRLAARCREVGALLVLDEVVTAFGRTGNWFAFEHWPGAEPDVLVLAKALGGGLPLGAMVTSPELSQVLSRDPPLGHVTTFGGNPVCCAAALAGIEVIEREGLVERSRRLGAALLAEFGELVGGGGLIAARGLGMLLGLEFETPTQTAAFVERCRRRGLLVGWTLHDDRVVRLAPPLNLGEREVAEAVSGISAALAG